MKKYYGPDFLTVSVLDTVKSFILPRHISLIHPPYNLTSRRLTSRRLTSRRLTSRRLTSRRMTSRRMTLVSQLASWSDCSFHKKNGPASLSRSRVVSFDVTSVDVTSDDVSQLVRLWFSSKKLGPASLSLALASSHLNGENENDLSNQSVAHEVDGGVKNSLRTDRNVTKPKSSVLKSLIAMVQSRGELLTIESQIFDPKLRRNRFEIFKFI